MSSYTASEKGRTRLPDAVLRAFENKRDPAENAQIGYLEIAEIVKRLCLQCLRHSRQSMKEKYIKKPTSFSALCILSPCVCLCYLSTDLFPFASVLYPLPSVS
jgi:hypothetical protein